MKTLSLIILALAAGTVTEVVGQRGVEIIPTSTNLFPRVLNPSGVPINDGRAILVGPSTNRFTSRALAGRSTNLHLVPLTNTAGGRMSGLIGPVFPARNVTLPASGRAIGAGGVIIGAGAGIGTNGFGTNGVDFIGDPLTNALPTGFGTGETGVGQTPATSVPGSSVPLPAGTLPLAPPTPVAPPAPTVPGSPNSVPNVRGSAVPAPPAGTPLAPPTGPALAPTTPAAPAPAAGGSRGGPGTGPR